jgi:hypothetical protein
MISFKLSKVPTLCRSQSGNNCLVSWLAPTTHLINPSPLREQATVLPEIGSLLLTIPFELTLITFLVVKGRTTILTIKEMLFLFQQCPKRSLLQMNLQIPRDTVILRLVDGLLAYPNHHVI